MLILILSIRHTNHEEVFSDIIAFMWYTKVFWKESILIETDAVSVFINPYFEYKPSQEYLLSRSPDMCCVVLTWSMLQTSRIVWENWCLEKGIACFVMLEDWAVAEKVSLHCVYRQYLDTSYLVVSYSGRYILYDDWISDPVSLEQEKYDLVLFKIDNSIEHSLALAAHLKPLIWVPLSVSDEKAIGFCRDLMLYHYAVPKYLKHWQYIVLGENQ